MSKNSCLVSWPATSSDFSKLEDFFNSHDIVLKKNPLGRNLKEEELIPLLEAIDGTIAGIEPYTRRVFESAKRLKVISRVGVGYENIDLKAAAENNVIITLTPIPELAVSVAEEAITLILTLLRKTIERDRMIRQGIWDLNVQIGETYTTTLGILGLGRIGAEVARRASTFGMKLQYHDKIRRYDLESELGIKYLSFDELLSQSEVVTIHVPSSMETRKLIGREELEKMKRDSYLINTARGDIVDESALFEMLDSGRLAGAGLGVYSKEPPSYGDPFYKLGQRLPSVVLLPHRTMGQATKERMLIAAANELLAVLEGRPPNYQLKL